MTDIKELESLLSAKMPIVAVESHEEQKVLKRTRPLSVIMAEKIAALRAWAKERAVPAD